MQSSGVDTEPQVHITQPSQSTPTMQGPPHRVTRELEALHAEEAESADVALDTTRLQGQARALAEGVLEEGRAERYELLRVLGNGGMGVVYKARDRALGRTVAIKTLRPSLQTHGEALRLMHHEAQVLAQIRHPNLPTIYDVLQHGRQVTIVMEYVRGEPLDAILERSPGGLEATDGLQIWTQLLTALGYLHGCGLLHRDIKPGNLMLERDGTLRLLDFGLAWELEEASQGPSTHGTPAYMAPEQIRGESLSAATDLYAAAATLYEALAGRPPFPGPQALRHHLYSEPTPLESLRADLPRALARQVMWCLRKDPRERPQEAARLRQELLGQLVPEASAPGPAEPSAGRLVQHPSAVGVKARPAAPQVQTHLGPPPAPRATQEARALPSSPEEAPAAPSLPWLRSRSPGLQRFLVLVLALALSVFTLTVGVLAAYVLGPLPVGRPAATQASVPPPSP
jgi:serine/threonine protein kinase